MGSLEALISKLASEYERRTPTSKAVYERASKVLPGGVSYLIRDVEPHPFYVSEASGCRVRDVDGNIYTDYWLGHGALILGHAHPEVVEKLRSQMEHGTHYGYAHELEVKLAEEVVKAVPSAELVRFTNSGTEAAMYAVRLARACTGRSYIAKFEGGWHGGYDCLHKAVKPPFAKPESLGLLKETVEKTVVLRFNDLDSVEQAFRKHDLACVVVEPVLGSAGSIPAEPDFLRGLRELCTENGTLLVFDEVITGFRVSLGGAQELYGVTPDLTILGKILGGGLPVGALCGRREYMELIDHRKHPNSWERSFHGGTFTANPATMTAGLATLNVLRRGGVYEHVDGLGERMRRGLEEVFEDLGFDACTTGVGSMLSIHLTRERPKRPLELSARDRLMLRALHMWMLLHGVAYVGPSRVLMFLSSSHTVEDVEHVVSVVEDFLRTLG